MVIDNSQSGEPLGTIYRLDEGQWTEIAVTAFPLGARRFRTDFDPDGQKSYLFVTTSLGRGCHYILDNAGIHALDKTAEVQSKTLQELETTYVLAPAIAFGLGIILGLVTWFLMWCTTKPDYHFGVHSLQLASLGRRGLARLIDLALIVGSTAALIFLFYHDLDWYSLLEVLNLRLDHQLVTLAKTILLIILCWMIAITLLFVWTQAWWGVTPGKWCCGLRTLRTTLRPCGFARSLARELMMYVDSGVLMLWTPGILSIALTPSRQRLGDLVSDTIVIDASSMSRGLFDDSSINQ